MMIAATCLILPAIYLVGGLLFAMLFILVVVKKLTRMRRVEAGDFSVPPMNVCALKQ